MKKALIGAIIVVIIGGVASVAGVEYFSGQTTNKNSATNSVDTTKDANPSVIASDKKDVSSVKDTKSMAKLPQAQQDKNLAITNAQNSSSSKIVNQNNDNTNTIVSNKTKQTTVSNTPINKAVSIVAINEGNGDFSTLKNYPYMVGHLSNGEDVIIPINMSNKSGNMLVANGYYTNDINSAVTFKISSLGNGSYAFYQINGSAVQKEFKVVNQGGSIFSGDDINSSGTKAGTVSLSGIYQGSIQDGYAPGSMMYHPFYVGTVGQDSVTFANLGNNKYLEYKNGSNTPYKVSVNWNTVSNAEMELVAYENGDKVGKYDVMSFNYSNNNYKGNYYSNSNNKAIGFSISGSYSPY